MGTWYIFNNIFYKTNANVPTSSGILAPMSDNGYLLNNTIIDAGGTGDNAYNCVNFYGTGWTAKNNVDWLRNLCYQDKDQHFPHPTMIIMALPHRSGYGTAAL